MTRGVGVAPAGGDREERARADPRGSDGARSKRSPRRGDLASEGRFRERSRPALLDAPRAERIAEQRNEDWGHVLCLVGR